MQAVLMTRVGALIAQIAVHDLVRHGFHVVLIVGAVLLAQRFAHRAIDRMVRRAITSVGFPTPEAERKREDTLIRIIDDTIRVVVWFIGAFFLLAELGVSTAPFIAAAGTLGLALSIGGQHCTRDLIAGVCITFEDQFRVGDRVCMNGITGVVHDFSLRITVIRDDTGAVHYVPNGTIATMANHRDAEPALTEQSPQSHAAPTVSAVAQTF
ncbi:mechanosensitive ion channel [Candidatus Uhrbacteria bacterium]|nr:mechanosensitive ion channel [Candidatus Uhrbacteria bacterium]